MKKFLIWSAVILTAFVAYAVIAHQLDGLSLAERLTIAIIAFPWYESGVVIGTIVRWSIVLFPVAVLAIAARYFIRRRAKRVRVD